MKIIIVILSILLVVSLIALGAVLIFRHVQEKMAVSAVIRDNYISYIQNSTSSEIKASAIVLSSRNSEDNVPFRVDNMFPGDRDTLYYQVEVSHKAMVKVKFHAEVRDGYEKLSEVLKCRVALVGQEVLYDGLMSDMPDSVTYALYANTKAKSTLLYEITAYLDTGVGNDYQEKDLIADFQWWVDDAENLIPPQTGCCCHCTHWIAIIVCFILTVLNLALLLVILMLLLKRKTGNEPESPEKAVDPEKPEEVE